MHCEQLPSMVSISNISAGCMWHVARQASKVCLAKCCEEPGTGNVCYSLCSANIQLSEDKAMSFSNVFSAFVSNTAVSFAR